MTDEDRSVWKGVPEDAETSAPMPEDHVEHGRWTVGEDAPMTSAHDNALAAAREAALAFFVGRVFTGSWTPEEDLDSWPEAYRREYLDELARLEAVGAGQA